MAGKRPSVRAVWTLMIAALFVFGGLAIYAKFSSANRVPVDELRDPAGGKLAQTGEHQPKSVVVLKPRYEGDDLTTLRGRRSRLR